MDIQLIRLIGEFVVDLTKDTLCKVVNDLIVLRVEDRRFLKLFVFGDEVNF